MRLMENSPTFSASKNYKMKKLALVVVIAGLAGGLVSCAARKGCPTNGRNVGAEKLLSGDPAAIKAAKKAKKFRS
jgi:hypothetical protein